MYTKTLTFHKYDQNSVIRYRYRLPIISNVHIYHTRYLSHVMESLDNKASLIPYTHLSETTVTSTRHRQGKSPLDPYSCPLLSLFQAVNINGRKRVSVGGNCADAERKKENAFVTLCRCIYRERKKEHSYLFVMQGERKIERGVFVTPPVSCN